MIMGINTCYYFFGSFAVSHHYIAPFFFLLFNQLGTFLICLPLPNPAPPPPRMTFLRGCPGVMVIYEAHRAIFGVVAMQTIHRTNN